MRLTDIIDESMIINKSIKNSSKINCKAFVLFLGGNYYQVKKGNTVLKCPVQNCIEECNLHCLLNTTTNTYIDLCFYQFRLTKLKDPKIILGLMLTKDYYEVVKYSNN